jgi:phosphoglycolate phosphatase
MPSFAHAWAPPLRGSFARLLATGDDAVVEQAVAHYRERFSDVGWKENVPYPGVAEALAALADDGTPMFLCTAKPETFARRIVEHFGFAPHFRGIYGADFAGRFDDKATLMAHLLANERVAPSGAVMIGDRHHDITAAARTARAPSACCGATGRARSWRRRRAARDARAPRRPSSARG